MTKQGLIVMSSNHYCYILEVEGDARYNYVGYTVNMARRIRQHNGELAGGAKITTRKSVLGHSWRVIALVTSDKFDHRRALSCEWWIKNPNGRKRNLPRVKGSIGRIQGLVTALSNQKFFEDCFTVWVQPEFRDILESAMLAKGACHCVLDLTTLTPHITTPDITAHDMQVGMERAKGEEEEEKEEEEEEEGNKLAVTTI